MPFLSILMAIISALASLKKNPEKKGQAVAAAALGGLGTYYVTHETEWGKDNLGQFDGVVPAVSVDASAQADANGNVTQPDGTVVTKAAATGTSVLADGTKIASAASSVPSTVNSGTTGMWDAVAKIGTGTAATVLATSAAGKSAFGDYFPWIAGGVILLLVLK